MKMPIRSDADQRARRAKDSMLSERERMAMANRGVYVPGVAGKNPGGYYNRGGSMAVTRGENIGPAPVAAPEQPMDPGFLPTQNFQFSPTPSGPLQPAPMSSMNPSNWSGVAGYSGMETSLSGGYGRGRGRGATQATGGQSGALIDPIAEAQRAAMASEHKRATPQEQAQKWGEMNIAASAAMPGSKAAPEINLFGGGNHLDTSFAVNGRTEYNKDNYDTWQAQTKEAARKIDEAFARRGDIPRTLDEAQEFVRTLPFDDRIGEFVERRVTDYIKKANPDLYNEITGRRREQQANDESFVAWYKRYSGDPNAYNLKSEQIKAMQTPQMRQQFENDPRSELFTYDPSIGKVRRLPQQQPSVEEVNQMKREERDYQRAEQMKANLITSAEKMYDKQLEKLQNDYEGEIPPEILESTFASHQERLARIEAGYGGTTPGQTAAAAPPPPQVGMVRNGFAYRGGDPTNPESWDPANDVAPEARQPGRGIIRLPNGQVITTDMLRPPATAPAQAPAPQAEPTTTPAAPAPQAEPMQSAADTFAPIPEGDLTDVYKIINARRAREGKHALWDEQQFIDAYGKDAYGRMVDKAFDELSAKNRGDTDKKIDKIRKSAKV